MTKEDISQEFRLKKIKEVIDYFFKELDPNKLLSSKNKKVFTASNYI